MYDEDFWKRCDNAKVDADFDYFADSDSLILKSAAIAAAWKHWHLSQLILKLSGYCPPAVAAAMVVAVEFTDE